MMVSHLNIRQAMLAFAQVFKIYQRKLFCDNLPNFDDFLKFNLQCYDSTLTSDAFLTTLKMSTNMDEVRSVLQKVEEEMARARSKDTGGVDGQSYLRSYITHFCVCKVPLNS